MKMPVDVDANKPVAKILAMGTANPDNVVKQSDYPDLFFRVTQSEHMLDLKNTFRRICAHSGIEKRHVHLSEKILSSNSDMCSDGGEPSLRTRQMIGNAEVTILGAKAAAKAIQQWGGKSCEAITHIVVATSNGVEMPGADLKIARVLGLQSSVKRVLLNQLGCSAGGAALRIAKDLAENDKDSVVLVVCSEVGAFTFRPPSPKHVDRLVGSAVMGDGAAAYIISANPASAAIFEIYWAGQFFIPDTEDALTAQLTEDGLVYFLSKHVPSLVSDKVLELVPQPMSIANNATKSMKIKSCNDMFWAIHPGGRAILDQIEDKLGLHSDKLAATREILANYGNMSSATVLFVLERLQQRSQELNCSSTGEGQEWGILLSFGPGLSVEMQLLRSCRLSL